MRVSIVGAGVGGLCAAWALAARGHRVTVLDAGDIPNPRGASADEHRMIRTAYGTLAGYADLMVPGFAAWERLWGDLGERLVDVTGLYYVLREDDGWYDAVRADLARLNVTFRDLPAGEWRARFPMIRPDGIERVVETGQGGVLFAGRIVPALVRLLGTRGVALRPRTRALACDFARGRVETEAGPIDADAILVVAGAWLPDLLPQYRGRTVPSRELLVYLEPPPDLAAAWAEAPPFSDRQPGGRGIYVLPPRRGTRLKFGGRAYSLRGHPDDDRDPPPAEYAAMLQDAGAALAGFGRYRVTGARACYYTVTHDHRFLIEGAGGGGFVLSACSGHGFKLAPLMGELAADAIAGRVTEAARRAAGRLR